ncbi:serine/threonine-protein kinase [Pseudonocardia sp. Cha107L01]|uniref:serine/threonine-protein kinase n=1 Tax=Pseudonocardia sp. Cha107L01 TaxID=3457576 RepID=UPI00403E5F19
MSSIGDASTLVLAQRYRLDERVGAGSMGAVWRATDELLGRTVAVKQLLLQPGAPGFDAQGQAYDEARQRILREGRLAARLQHPHAIAVFDVVLHDDAPWLVMEYLPSRTLGALLNTEGPLDPRHAADIGRQIADGLAAAHAAGIVHRDIKPGNVLIGADGIVKITDFGVSRAADDVQLTRTGLIAGTPAYLAPETARGQNPTTASDVFALGSTLYTAVEGEPPFGLDDNAYALLYKVGAGTIRPPEHAGPLTDALLRMLRADPADRPTATEAKAELAAVAAGQQPPGPAAPPSRPSAAPRRPTPAKGTGARKGRRNNLSATRVDLDSLPPTAASPPPARSDPALPSPTWPIAAVSLSGSPDPTDAGAPAAAAEPVAAPPARSRPDPVEPPRDRQDRPRRAFGPFRLRKPTPPIWALIALVVVAVAAVATLAVLRRDALPGLGSIAAGSPPASAKPSAAPPVKIRPDGQPTAADLESFIRGYYALLPGDPAAAWAELGPAAQSASNGYQSYQSFYAGLDSVGFAEQPTAVDGKTVRATLRFVPKSGGESVERYQFTVVPGPDGTLIMSSFERG